MHDDVSFDGWSNVHYDELIGIGNGDAAIKTKRDK